MAVAHASVVDEPRFQAGSRAFQQGDYVTAAAEFLATWSTLPPDATFQKSVVASRLLEAWYRSGNYKAAVVWYRVIWHPSLTDDLAYNRPIQRWAALAMLETREYAECADIFAKLSEQSQLPPKEKRSLSTYRAHALFREGKSEQAYRQIFPDYEVPTDAKEAYFYAGICYETERWPEAESYCRQALELPPPAEDEVFPLRVSLLQARSLAKAGYAGEAITALIELIEERHHILTIYPAFDSIMQMITLDERDRVVAKFDKWAHDPISPNRQLAAKYYSILLIPSPDESTMVDRLENFILENREHALAKEAQLMLSSINPELAAKYTHNIPEHEIDELTERLIFENAVKLFQNESFETAKQSFLEISTRLQGKKREQALFNSAIAALYDGDQTTFDRLEREISRDDQATSAIHAELLFLAGLFHASKADPRAFALLTDFCQAYPEHSSNNDARLALAELHLNQVPAQTESAKQILQQLRSEALSPQRRERLDYILIWVELLTPGFSQIRESVYDFLERWPSSNLRPEVTMLLATDLYRSGDYGHAAIAFAEIVEHYPDSSYRDAALYFSAEAEERQEIEMDRINPRQDYWGPILENAGSFTEYARHRQALSLLRVDRFDEAIRIFEQIAKADIPQTELKLAAQCDKAYALYMKGLAFGNDARSLQAAAEAFAAIESNATASQAWRYQAAVRRGKCLELLGLRGQALDIYQKLTTEAIANQTSISTSAPIQESQWLYRAGFSAIEMLEANKDWKGAVSLAEALADQGGPRAVEAAQRAEALRLRYFIWD